MCQLVATLIHLLSCRYECRKFGFWGAFLAGRFCVYITQMNFHFYRFSALFALSYLVLFYRFSILFFILFSLCSFTADSCYLSYCILCLLSAGAGWCHFWLVG